MKWYLIIFFALIFNHLFAQTEKRQIDKKRICQQIEKSIRHLEGEKEFRFFKISSDDILRNGFGYDFISTEYVAGKLNVGVKDIQQQDKERVSSYMKI